MELVILVAVTMGVIGLAGRLPEPRLVKRDLARARLDSLASLADGKVVTLRGMVEQTEPAAHVISPVSGRACVYWLVTFDEVSAGGDHREIGRAEAGCPFELATPSGRVRVVANAARLGVHGDDVRRPMRDLANAELTDSVIALARSVCRPANHPRWSALRMTEYVVAARMQVTLKGVCTYEPDPTATDDVDGVYRGGELPTRPVISGSRRERLLIG